MMLNRIIAKKNKRVEEKKKLYSMDFVIEKAEKASEKNYNFRSFFDSLHNKNGISIIAEIKKASPSKGIISENFPIMEYAEKYNDYADAISVLTEEDFFLGSDDYLKMVKGAVDIPVLRKDFIIDEYQIYESKILGADAILLICSILTDEQIKKYLSIAKNLKMDCLVEAHDEKEVTTALECGSKIIGINNRNLKTFEVDIRNTKKLAENIPNNIVKISESGINTREDIKYLESLGVDGVLIGEAFMRAEDVKRKFMELRGLND
jgi:indole-3-glycerol phosphate synthase